MATKETEMNRDELAGRFVKPDFWRFGANLVEGHEADKAVIGDHLRLEGATGAHAVRVEVTGREERRIAAGSWGHRVQITFMHEDGEDVVTGGWIFTPERSW
jgi:hypothetical protein